MSGSAWPMRLAPEPTEEYHRLSIRQAENRPAPACTPVMSASNPMLGPDVFVPNATDDSRRPSPDGLDLWATSAASRSLQHAAPLEAGCAPEEW
jgi:hypothetical protein